MHLELVTPRTAQIQLSAMVSTPFLYNKIRAKQKDDPDLFKIFERIRKGKAVKEDGFKVASDDSLHLRSRWCIPHGDEELKKKFWTRLTVTLFSTFQRG